MKKTNLWIIGGFALAGLIYLSSFGLGHLFGQATFWTWREEIMLLLGVVAFVFMTLAMVISVRPRWIDSAMDGLDKAYGLHKWAGICAAVAATMHWLAENAPKWVVDLGWLEHPGHLGGAKPAEWQLNLVHSGAVVGEWAFYILVAMVVAALIQKIPYRWFRYAHKVFPVIYIAVAYHAIAVLLKNAWWSTPAAYLLVALAAVGCVCAVISLTQGIGRSRKVGAVIDKIDRFDNGIVDIELRIENGGFSHQQGQFAFVRFDFDNEPHPFTIASSGEDPKRLRFAIKALGDFTNTLAAKIHEGQAVEVEGPYGRFDFDTATERQVWVAGGIGVTPFMSRLEALAQNGSAKGSVDFWYCTRNESDAAFPVSLEELCQKAGVVLHRIEAFKEQTLNAEAIRTVVRDLAKVHVWFCGPQAFAQSLQNGLVNLGFNKNAFHYDRFNMR